MREWGCLDDRGVPSLPAAWSVVDGFIFAPSNTVSLIFIPLRVGSENPPTKSQSARECLSALNVKAGMTGRSDRLVLG